MFQFPFEISPETKVSDIVKRDYRTADVFRRYGISYCCGGNWPVAVACKMTAVDPSELIDALKASVRNLRLPGQTDFQSWETVFLVDYIVNVHHHYLKISLPLIRPMLADFVTEHAKKFNYLHDLLEQFDYLLAQLNALMETEEQVLFPYIRQLAHAHRHPEPYGALFIRSFRKPAAEMMTAGIGLISSLLTGIRLITKQYITPENACVSHIVVISKLRELDVDLEHHFHLEQSVLYPKIIQLEKDLLGLRGPDISVPGNT